MKIFKVLTVVFFFAVSAFASEVKVHIPLSPAGSFDAKAKIHNGVAMKKGKKFLAKNMFVVGKELKTGIDLRDEHLWERLHTKKFPKIKVLKAEGEKGRGIASVSIRGVKKKVPFTYKFKGKKADFTMENISKVCLLLSCLMYELEESPNQLPVFLRKLHEKKTNYS